MVDAHVRIPKSENPRIVVIGGGFAGLEFIKKLRNKPVQVVLFDKNNHHTFQPLLYQVATAGLETSSIIYPFRKAFEDDKNILFRMGEVIEIFPDEKKIETSIGWLEYDYLVIATGATTNFYGMKDIEKYAIPLKNISDAIAVRNNILTNLEKSLLSDNNEYINSLMDYVVVGGGPTGVEVSGALAELKSHVFPNDYKELDLAQMDIHLIEASPRLLNGMSEQASKKAKEYLERLGVKVHLGVGVTSYDGYTVKLNNGNQIITRTLLWAAGVKGLPIKGLNPETVVRGNRLKVDELNRVVGYENVFALGDVAAMVTEKSPNGHPMMAPPAMQQGRWLGKNILNLLKNKPMKPFEYLDKGSMATIGRNKAVVDMTIPFKFKMQGIIAWFIWMFVHLLFIVGFKNRFAVLFTWIWSYFTYDKGTRLIVPSRKPLPEPENKDEQNINPS